MADTNEYLFLLFNHSSNQSQARVIRKTLESLSSPEKTVLILHGDEKWMDKNINLEKIDGLIILYTPQLAKSSVLFDLLQNVSPRSELKRFFIFPRKDGTNETRFPAVFHSLRFQQHNLFFYPQSTQEDINPAGFVNDLTAAFKKRLMEDALPAAGRDSNTRSLRWGRRFLVSLIGAALVIPGIYLMPHFMDSMRTLQMPVLSSVKAPSWNAFWLDESFTFLNTSSVWNETSLFRGRVPASTYTEDKNLSISAEPGTIQASYEIESIESWPLDSLEGFETSILMEKLEEPDAEAELRLQIELEENEGYFFGCGITPDRSTVEVECFIQEPEERVVLAIEQPLTPQDMHKLAVRFDPENYTIQVFVDDMYAGRAVIPTPADWRKSSFKLSLAADFGNLVYSGYSVNIFDISLAYQEQAAYE